MRTPASSGEIGGIAYQFELPFEGDVSSDKLDETTNAENMPDHVLAHLLTLYRALHAPYSSSIGVAPYLANLALTYAAIDLVIAQHPNYGLTRSSDRGKLMHVMICFQGHGGDASYIWDRYHRCIAKDLSFDQFIEDIQSRAHFLHNVRALNSARKTLLATSDCLPMAQKVLSEVHGTEYTLGPPLPTEMLLSKPVMKILDSIDPTIVKRYYAKLAEMQPFRTPVANGLPKHQVNSNLMKM
jgi:hypothetical protein